MRHYIAAILAAITVFLVVSGTRIYNLTVAHNKIETSLGVQIPSDFPGTSPLRNVEIYPYGLAKVELNGIAGEPDTWLTEWYRLSDIGFEQSDRSLVRWTSGKLIIEHQQLLAQRGKAALGWEVLVYNIWSLLLVPAIWAIVVGGLIFLGLANREHNRLLNEEEGCRKAPRYRRRHA